MDQMTESEALAQAIRIIGSASALARELGISKGAISQWKRVPADHCPDIESLTKGEVVCEQLRPDVSWNVLRKPRRKSRSQAT
jgi:DNA-binding transcriptional regulator YdaS (Cro superfamily)